MKNICRLFVYAFLAFSLLLISCSKKMEPDPISILTSKTWKYSTVDRTPGSHIDIPFNMVSDCEKDDTFEFKNDQKLIIYNSVLKCAVGDPPTKVIDYVYNKETKELTIDGVKCTVISLTKDQLKYKIPVSYHTGFVFVVTILE